MTWAKNSWDNVAGRCAAAPQAGYMDKCSFKESVTAGQRLGLMVLQQTESWEIPAGIRHLESQDDVLEADDSTVFE